MYHKYFYRKVTSEMGEINSYNQHQLVKYRFSLSRTSLARIAFQRHNFTAIEMLIDTRHATRRSIHASHHIVTLIQQGD